MLILVVRSGEIVPYTGGRMAPEMLDWLEKKIGPPAKVLESLEEVEKFTTASDVAVVGFFTKDSEEKVGWLSACLDYDDYGVHYPVAVTTDSAAAEKFGVSNGVVLFRGEEQIKYTGDYTVQDLRDFMTEQAIPLIVEFNHETAQQIFKPPNNQKSHLLVFHEGKEEQQTKEVKGVMEKVGVEFKDQVIFVSVDVDVEDHRRMVEFLGIRHRINNDTYPTFRVITMKDSLGPVRFRPKDTTVEEDNLRTFLQQYTQGKVAKDYFVEPLPKDWNDKDVKYLTAMNVKEITENPETQALVMYYAPWCGHCKTLIPVWDALGAKYSNSDTVLAKMDSTVNEVEGSEKINSFPTIRLHRKDGTQAEYNGERTVEGITKFLDSDGVYGMAAPDHDEL